MMILFWLLWILSFIFWLTTYSKPVNGTNWSWISVLLLFFAVAVIGFRVYGAIFGIRVT